MNDIHHHVKSNDFVNNIYPQVCKGYQYIPANLGPVPRLLLFGDIHGDYNLFINMLKIANVAKINGDEITWTGKNTYVVQIGDQIDRCRPIGNMTCQNPVTTFQDEASDIKIMELANNLHKQASKEGGAFISLLGNHELMNSSGLMSYVSHKGLQEFDNYIDKNNPSVKFKNGHDARVYAFSPGNEYGKMMGCTRLPAIIIGSHLMVHAGIVDGLLEELQIRGNSDLESINVAVRMWLLGMLKKKFIKKIINSSKTSMFWTRILGNIPPNVSLTNPVCKDHIGKTLQTLKIGSMIIGHTPQSFTYSDDINQTCSGKIWRVDNGSSSAFHRFDKELMSTGKINPNRRPQILEIINDSEYFMLDEHGRKKLS